MKHAMPSANIALVYSLDIQTAVLETLFSERSDGGRDDGPVADVEFLDRVSLEPGLPESVFIKGIGIDDYHGRPFQPFRIRLQCGRVHRHQKVAVVSRSIYILAPDVYLEAGNPGNGPVRGPDFSREIWECGQPVPVYR